MVAFKTLQSSSGTYILLLEVLQDVQISVSSYHWEFKHGMYLYFGSAKGSTSTSLGNRLKRHFIKKKKKFWHIDYLTTHSNVNLQRSYYKIDPETSECINLAEVTDKIPTEVIVNFGSSDCIQSCGGHLVFLSNFWNNISSLDQFFSLNNWNIIFGDNLDASPERFR